MRDKIFAALLGFLITSFVTFLVLSAEPTGRPDIRIIGRIDYDAVYGPCFELQWSVNGSMQNPAYFQTEEERVRYEDYLATVGRVTE